MVGNIKVLLSLVSSLLPRLLGSWDGAVVLRSAERGKSRVEPSRTRDLCPIPIPGPPRLLLLPPPAPGRYSAAWIGVLAPKAWAMLPE